MSTTSVSHFRGHLFADLRGSTAFTERAGNAAGADLVRRFRQLVRDEVGEHDGAEVKTEGDAIYVVFPSASTAVMCGLAIIQNAADANAADPSAPMHVGVGVHAGEAVQVPEGGYIGTAVNLAARICSVAQAGEVLVSGTVRGIAQASIPVTFVARGRRRLKGISEPVDFYLVVPDGTPMPTRRRITNRWLAAGAAAVVLLVLAGGAVSVLLSPLGAGSGNPTPSSTALATVATSPTSSMDSASPSPSARVITDVPHIGLLDIGEYVTGGFQPPFTFTVADPGWSLTRDVKDAVGLRYSDNLDGTLDIGRVSKVYLDPCSPDGASVPRIASANELITALRGAPHLTVGDAVPIESNGVSGVAVDVGVDPDAFIACDGAAGVSVLPLGGEDYVAQLSEHFKLRAFDIDNAAVAILSKVDEGPDVSTNRLEAFYALADKIVASIIFGSHSPG